MSQYQLKYSMRNALNEVAVNKVVESSVLN